MMKRTVHLYGIPFSKGSISKNEGCKDAPNQIHKALSNYYLNENLEEIDIKYNEINIDSKNIELFYENLERRVKSIDKNNRVGFLGGDHSLTYPIVKAIKPEALIIFDAHLDCQDEFMPPTHEDFLRALINEKTLREENVFHIGLRNLSKEEKEWLDKSNINLYGMKDYSNLDKVYDKIIPKIENKNTHISFDFDVLDISTAFATGYPEPAGFNTREIINFISKLKKFIKLNSFDFVEFNPNLDKNKIGLNTASKVVNELL
ncbi:MAG: arginase family protein [Candidatus Woesearchaeota archaeon]